MSSGLLSAPATIARSRGYGQGQEVLPLRPAVSPGQAQRAGRVRLDHVDPERGPRVTRSGTTLSPGWPGGRNYTRGSSGSSQRASARARIRRTWLRLGPGRVVISASWRSDRLASFAENADESSQGFHLRVPGIWHPAPGRGKAVGLTCECAAGRDPGLAAHAGCYLGSLFLAAAPSLAPSSGLVASSTLSANFRWETSSCSAKS